MRFGTRIKHCNPQFKQVVFGVIRNFHKKSPKKSMSVIFQNLTMETKGWGKINLLFD